LHRFLLPCNLASTNCATACPYTVLNERFQNTRNYLDSGITKYQSPKRDAMGQWPLWYREKKKVLLHRRVVTKGTQRTDSADLSNKGHQPRYTLMTSDTNVTNRNVCRLGMDTSLQPVKAKYHSPKFMTVIWKCSR